jgi:hypothetical protein
MLDLLSQTHSRRLIQTTAAIPAARTRSDRSVLTPPLLQSPHPRRGYAEEFGHRFGAVTLITSIHHTPPKIH